MLSGPLFRDPAGCSGLKKSRLSLNADLGSAILTLASLRTRAIKDTSETPQPAPADGTGVLTEMLAAPHLCAVTRPGRTGMECLLSSSPTTGRLTCSSAQSALPQAADKLSEGLSCSSSTEPSNAGRLNDSGNPSLPGILLTKHPRDVWWTPRSSLASTRLSTLSPKVHFGGGDSLPAVGGSPGLSACSHPAGDVWTPWCCAAAEMDGSSLVLARSGRDGDVLFPGDP